MERLGGDVRLSRRALVLGGPLVLLGAGCEAAPDKVIEDEIGQWRIWGTRKADGDIDYSTGHYAFEIKKRALLARRRYPYSVKWEIGQYKGVRYQGGIIIGSVTSRELYAVGVFGEVNPAVPTSSQWSQWLDNPDYTNTHTVRASYKDFKFENSVTWNGRPLTRG